MNKKNQQPKKMGRPTVTPGIIALTIVTQHTMGMRVEEIAYRNGVSSSTVSRVLCQWRKDIKVD